MRDSLISMLAARFDLDDLDADASSHAFVLEDGTIRWLSKGWFRFAAENDGAASAARFGVDRSYFDGISGELREHFARVVARCVRTGEPWEQDYECSSPAVRRDFHVRFVPVAPGVLISHSLVRAAPHAHAAHPPLAALYQTESGLVTQCSNCRRVRRADGSAWDWVPAWVAQPPECTSHGLCALCLGFYYPP